MAAQTPSQIRVTNIALARKRRQERAAEVIARREADERVTICGRCGAASVPLPGAAGRAWFANHRCPTGEAA